MDRKSDFFEDTMDRNRDTRVANVIDNSRMK